MPAYSIRRGPELPANPRSGKVFIKNAGASQGLYVCQADGTWVGPFSTGGGGGITNDAPVGGIPTTGDVDGNLIAQDDVPLVDPGNVWEPETVVAEGHRFAETVAGALRVFEVTAAGTTGAGVFTDYGTPDLAPLGEWGTGSETFVYIGIVGQISWNVAPVLAGGLEIGPIQDNGHELIYTSAAAPGDGEDLFSFRSTVSSVPKSVFEAATDGDADWMLDVNASAGFRFNVAEDGNIIAESGKTEITTLGFNVFTPTAGFHVTYAPFSVSVAGAPLKLTPIAFASLPASPEEGMMAWVNDSNTATWGANVAGGGANKVLAVYNGTNWTVAGK